MKKVFIGCGVVVGLFILASIGLSIFSYQYLKQRMPDTQQLEQLREQHDARFGQAKDYLPPIDGTLSPERVELFMDIRDRLRTYNGRTNTSLKSFVEELTGSFPEEDDSGKSVFEKIRGGMRTLDKGFDIARMSVGSMSYADSLFLAKDMGRGEYGYLYNLILFSWLQWDPYEMLKDVHKEPDDKTWELTDSSLTYLSEYFHQQLSRQLRTLQDEPQRSPLQEDLLSRLEEELRQHRRGRFPLPFFGNLPPAYVEILAPHEEKLRSSIPSSFEEMLVEHISTLDADIEGGNIQIQGNH